MSEPEISLETWDSDTGKTSRAVCRTCGFIDCPGANDGECPRWQETPRGVADELFRRAFGKLP